MKKLVNLTGLNIIRAFLNFLIGIFLARSLGPKNYGDLIFLIATFTSIKSIIDLGVENAFFTFLCEGRKSITFIYHYLLLILLQVMIIAIIILFIPDKYLEIIFVNQNKLNITFAFLLFVVQNKIWEFLIVIAESNGLNIHVQIINIIISIALILIFFTLDYYNELNINNILISYIAIYLIVSICTYKILIKICLTGNCDIQFKDLNTEYVKYCLPLVGVIFLSFIYTFTDNWLLQNYAGSIQQAYVSVGLQFASIMVVFNSAVIKIFSRKISQLRVSGLIDEMRDFYFATTKILFTTTALFAGICIPWSGNLILLLYGDEYLDSINIIVVYLIYPLYQSMGHLFSSFLFASRNTKYQFSNSLLSVFLGIPLTYIFLASKDNLVPGFDLGGFGFAFKIAILAFINVNLSIFLFCKQKKWKFEFSYQIKIAAITSILSLLSYCLSIGIYNIYLKLIVFSLAYGLLLYIMRNIIFSSQDLIMLKREFS